MVASWNGDEPPTLSSILSRIFPNKKNIPAAWGISIFRTPHINSSKNIQFTQLFRHCCEIDWDHQGGEDPTLTWTGQVRVW